MKNNTLFVLVILFLVSCQDQTAVKQASVTATDTPEAYKSEHIKGYEGGFIKGLKVPKKACNFLVIGDWGRCGEYYQKELAEQLSYASLSLDANFIISTGDNFYQIGVSSVDDPLWNSSYENVYRQFSLQIPWFVVLGNHDIVANPQAEIDYSKKSSRWHVPDWRLDCQDADWHMAKGGCVKIPFDEKDTTKNMLFIFLNTNPFIDTYYSYGSDYRFYVKSKDSVEQKLWLRKTLAASERDHTIRWRFVIGHHPLFTNGKHWDDAKQLRGHLKALFDSFHVDAYICGHDHDLEYLKPEGYTQYFVSGAGSEVRKWDTTHLDKSTKWQSKTPIQGFMTFSVTYDSIMVNVIDRQGKILYDTSIMHQ